MSYFVNRSDISFLLYDVLNFDKVSAHSKYESYDRDSVQAILDTAEKVAEDHYYPCASEIDAFEPEFVEGKAITHPSVGKALKAFAEVGFFGMSYPADRGGMEAPLCVSTAMNSIFFCANLPVQNYVMLTNGVTNLIQEFGSEEQIATFFEPLRDGEWFGTMCLSEPQAGSSLSDIRTKAEPKEDGTYAITGTKMWISGGEQDITDNIVHMVLAKIPGGPAGVKGISLFIVPKIRVNADGSLGEQNNVALAGLNHKMGQRGTTNTLLNFGEGGETIGYLIGEPHRGLQYMFQMMNEARIAVGHGATMSGLGGYLYSLDYARERKQGRSVTNKDPNSPQISIADHADVKRMLLAQKAYVEGAYSLVLYAASLVDEMAICDDASERETLSDLLDFLTPIVKSWPSEYCLEANKLAIQVLGGYGYTRDYPVERFYRDNRLNHIHEGTYAIHGLDLLGRKVTMKGGSAFKTLTSLVNATVDAAVETFPEEASALKSTLAGVSDALVKVQAQEDPSAALANATLFLDAMGLLVVSWMWLRQALAASNKGSEFAESSFGRGKVRAMRYFFRYELPKTALSLSLVSAADQTCAEASLDEFIGEA